MLDRESLSEKFDVDNFPVFWCSTCLRGQIILERNSIVWDEPNYSILAKDIEGWEPNWRSRRFSARLKCVKSDCGEVAIMTGTMSLQEDWVDGIGWNNTDLFHPQAITPSPMIFQVPDETPEEIQKILNKCFSLYFQDKNSSMNKMRIVVELILDERGIPREMTNKNGTNTRISLHQRIQLLRKFFSEPADSLLAAKEVGNFGSHEPLEIDKEIAIDILQLVSSAIDDLYGGIDGNLKAKRRKLIQSRGRKNR